MIARLAIVLALTMALIGCGCLTESEASDRQPGTPVPLDTIRQEPAAFPVPPAPTVPQPAPAPQAPLPVADEEVEARLVDRIWISPAEVKIGNYYPGARAEWDLRLHNGKATKQEFAISYRIPNRAKEGFCMPSQEAEDWVIIADMTPVLAPKETRDILVALDMPRDVNEWSISVWNLTEKGKEVKSKLLTAYQETAEAAARGLQPLPEKPPLLIFLESVYGKEVDKAVVPAEYKNYVVPTDLDKWEFWISVMESGQGQLQTEMCSRWLVSMR